MATTNGQGISLISASGQTIAGIVTAIAPIGGAIAVNPAAGLITLVKVGIDSSNGYVSIGDAVSIVANSVYVTAAVCAVVPGGQPFALGLMTIGRAMQLAGIGLTLLKAQYPLGGPPFLSAEKNYSQQVNDNFIASQSSSSPIILDLDGDGLEISPFNRGALTFDHNADGIRTGTAWVSPDDGLLVFDRNGNGTIDSGRELFGNNTLLASGQYASDGYAALRDLDSTTAR